MRVLLFILACLTLNLGRTQIEDSLLIVASPDTMPLINTSRSDLHLYNGQNFKVVEVKNPKGYYYFPDSVFADSITGISFKDVNTKAMDTSHYRLYWGTLCNDGYFEINITPQQIYLSSSHENPNPNFLFWSVSIELDQYQSIKEFLKKGVPNGFSQGYRPQLFYDSIFNEEVTIPNVWSRVQKSDFDLKCDEQMEAQLTRYFRILNETLPKNRKITPPSLIRRKAIRPKLLGRIP